MFGFIYFIVIGAMLIYSAFEYQELRKRSRNDAMKRGHLDYVDYKGKQWYGDRRAAYMYKDGRKLLVDLKHPEIVYIDITAEKEKEEEKNPFVIKQKKEAAVNLYRCCGSARHTTYIDGSKRVETETGRTFTYRKERNKFYIQYKTENKGHFWDDGKEIEVSQARYEYLCGHTTDTDTEELFLMRFQYMKENGLFNKFGIEDPKPFRLDYTFDPEFHTYSKPIPVYVCAKTGGQAKRYFRENWLKYSHTLEELVTATEIELAE